MQDQQKTKPLIPKIPWHRNPIVRALVAQVVLVAIVAVSVAEIFSNTVTNMENRGIKVGLFFLDDVAPFSIPLNFHPFWEFTLGESTYWDVFIIGIQNTLVMALMGIPAATFIGVIIGIILLSPNWLLSKLALAFVEFFRNTPLLLQLLFWAFAVFPPLFNSLPSVKDSTIIGGTVINSSGIYFPAPIIDGWAFVGLLSTLTAAAVLSWALTRWERKRRDKTGQQFPVFLASCTIFLLFILTYFIVIGEHLAIEFPVKKGLNYQGGIRPPKELFVLWFGLTIYTSAFIAENVRAGIIAVGSGQSEAGMALGLSRMVRMRLIIMPQALRVIIPPTINQFLNLAKNSSLAIAVGYPDITNIWMGLSLNQTGQALIIVGMTILVYEIISLFTSLITNLYNKSVQIRER